jgi:hypothetical protein
MCGTVKTIGCQWMSINKQRTPELKGNVLNLNVDGGISSPEDAKVMIRPSVAFPIGQIMTAVPPH